MAISHRIDVKSYTSLHTLVNDMFPPTSLVEQVKHIKSLKIPECWFHYVSTNAAVIVLCPCRKTIMHGIFGKYRIPTLIRSRCTEKTVFLHEIEVLEVLHILPVFFNE